MRLRTGVAVGCLLLALGALAVAGLGVLPAGGSLAELWVSDTPRDNTINHHAVGVGPDGEVIVAPVTEVPNAGTAITDDSCLLARLAPESGATTWRRGLPADACAIHALTEPAVADVDADGTLEAVTATTERSLVARDVRDGAEEWRLPLDAFGYGSPTVADVHPAPGPEVVASDIGGGVVLAHGNGSVAWRFALNSTLPRDPGVWRAPTVADVDADGRPEIVLGSNRGLVVLTARGEVEWARDGPGTHLAVAQADDDPALEVFGTGTSAVRAYDGADGAREWNRTLSNARIRAAADADGDGTVELYAGRVGGEVLALDAATGRTEWTTSVSRTDGVLVPPPALGDVDGDGDPEVLAVAESGTASVLAADSGTELATYRRTVPLWTFASTAHLDDDGVPEILLRYGDGRVVGLDYES
jgi:outer membrane protein assembly factor BamB